MGTLNYSPREITHALEHKLGVLFQDARERKGWYVLDGRKRFKFRIPRVHPSWGPGTIHSIVRTSRLTKSEFSELVACPLTRDTYDTLLRERLPPSK